MKLWLNLFLCAFFLAGAFITKLGIDNIKTAKNSENWPQINGVIVRSEIVSQDDSYRPLIQYTYTVKNQAYTNQTIYFGDGGATGIRSYSERYVFRYPVYQKVSVFYNPANPSISVLEPGVQKATFIQFVVGSGFTFLASWASLIIWLLS